ncbi:hypothetical protein [uncultured Friedmanniella sp.]|uniref:hypothetical protein n=1 Tax=uncultured Friedmanniella sp. TaxID=335381 RepID=UPI0035CC214A
MLRHHAAVARPRPGRLLVPLIATAVATTALTGSVTPAQSATVTAGAAITVRGTSGGSSTGTSSVEVTAPSGVVAGDVLVARVANRGDVTAELTGAGWEEAGTTHSSAMVKSVVLTRVATADEPASYTFGSSVETPLVASVSAFDHVDTVDPVDTYAGKVNGNVATFTTPTLKSTAGNAMAVWFGTQLSTGSNCDALQITPPSSFTESLDSCLPASSGLAIETSYDQLGAAASRKGLVGRSGAARTNVTQVLTLRPAAAVQAADRYVGASVDVGKLWNGYAADGSHDTALPDSELHEPSGLAASRVNTGVQYVHSESDVEGMVAVRTSDARVVGRYDVAIPDQWDWEDIATGPCPTGSCIFAGDIGLFNGLPHPPSTFAVYRVTEPDLAAGETSGTLTGDWFRFRYPDGVHNAEALMVHPTTGRVYVITKEESGVSGVYAFPTTLPAASATTVTTLTKVATLHVPTWTGDPSDTHAATWYAQVSAAAIHPAANRFLIRTPYMVWEYRGTTGGSFDTALAATPVALTAPSGEQQGEAIEYAPDGSAYYTLSERPAPPFTLKRVDRR